MDKEWVLAGFIILVMGLAVGWLSTSEAYYSRGISNARIYHEATGDFPNQSWVKKSVHKTYEYTEQITESLKEFTLGRNR